MAERYAQAARRAVHSATDGVVYALDDILGLTKEQRSLAREALTEFAGSILDLVRADRISSPTQADA